MISGASGGYCAESTEAQLQAEYRQAQLDLENLQEQLRIAQRTQADQVKEIRILRLETSRLNEKSAALELDLEQARAAGAQVRQLQAERMEMQQQMDGLQSELDRVRRQLEEREQGFAIDRQASEAQHSRLQQEKQRLDEELQRERAQSADGIATQGQQPVAMPSAPVPAPVEPVGNTASAPASSGLESAMPEPAPAAIGEREFVSPRPAQVVVQRLNESRDFFVLSMEGIPGVKEGSVLILSSEDQPVAEVELGSLDKTGLAMAYVTRALKDLSWIQEGTALSARVLVRTSAVVSPKEQ